MKIEFLRYLAMTCFVSLFSLDSFAYGQAATEWEKVLAAAKKEGKLVLNIPPSAELRKALEDNLKQKFGLDVEIFMANSAPAVKRVADEFKAGVRYFDVITSTWDSLSYSLLPAGAVEPLEPQWILPEVKDPKNWWGGHIWTDGSKKYAYSPYAYLMDNIWYNTGQVKSEDVRLYDDLLNPKWKGKIGLWDPRAGGASIGIWGYLWLTKGEGYLQKLVDQNLQIVQDRRLIADSLARGKVSIAIGATYYSYASFIKAGLPIKPFPPFKEGTFVSVGNGGPVMVRNPPHPNAAKVFINWILSKEGQQVYGKAFGQATRRLDVDTTWMSEIGLRPAKDNITLEQFYKGQNALEETNLTVRRPSEEFARKILP